MVSPQVTLNSTNTKERNDGRQRRTYNETDPGSDGLDDERDGAYRPRCIPLVNFCRPRHGGRARSVDVGGHLLRPAALPGYGRMLCGDGEALSRHGQLLLLRRAGVSQPRQGVALCAHFEVYRRLGLAPVLLDLSWCDGGCDGSPRGLP